MLAILGQVDERLVVSRDQSMPEARLPLEEFLSAGHLQQGDIVLFRRKGNFFARNLTRLTGDYFSHSGLVFATPHADPGFTKTYILECNFSGVDITPMDRFIRKRGAYVLCIKRLERDWFDARMRKVIRGHALNYIKAEYSFRTLTDLFLRTEAHLLFPKRKSPEHRAQALERNLRRGFKLPRAFICSGFVQYAYFEAVKRAMGNDLPSPAEEVLADCYFANERWTNSLQADLLCVTPQNMADTSRLSWKYLIHQGDALEVSSQDEALAHVQAAEKSLKIWPNLITGAQSRRRVDRAARIEAG